MVVFVTYYTSRHSDTGNEMRYHSGWGHETEASAVDAAKRALSHVAERAEIFKVESEPVAVWDSKVSAEDNVGAGI